MEPQHIIIRNIDQGGIADSEYVGAPNSVAECVGLDIHSKPGIVRLSQRLTEIDDSASPIDGLIGSIVNASDGNTYFFSRDSGKVWKRTSAGVWSLAHTSSPAAGNAGTLCAREYQGYIYYAMESRLGRFDMASTWSDSWATFGVTDDTYHPMRIVNLVLYIGDGNQVAQVDGTTFSANALDLKDPLRVSALGKLSTDLLIGTYVASNVTKTEIFRWNTWSTSFSVSDEIPEVGVNAFLETDNLVIVNAGTKGNMYVYNGQQLELYKSIKGDWTTGNRAIVYSEAVLNFHGMPLFGLSATSGNGAPQGVYSLHRTNRGYPMVLNLPYPISTGNTSGVTIGAIGGNGDTFYVAWKDTTDSTTYGVDILDLSNKYASGYFLTRTSLYDRMKKSTYREMKAAYASLPANTSIELGTSRNHAAVVNQTVVDDTDRKVVQTAADCGDASAFAGKCTLNGSGNSSPEIEQLDIAVT